MIYLDHNATTFYSPSVRKFVQEQMVDLWANPSSEHALGSALGDEIKLIRAEIAEFLDCSSKGLIFTSGATESINTVLSPDNLRSLGVKNIISSKMEHHATLDRLKYLEKHGFKVHFLNNDENGNLDLFQLDRLLASGSKSLVSLLFANNETGVINPIRKISEIVRKNGQLINIDGVQALGKINFSLDDLDVDFMSFSGHKIGAFKGIGLLYSADIKSLSPLFHGGGQERGYRPGTLNYPGIKSLQLALRDLKSWDLEKMRGLKSFLETKLEEDIKGMIVCKSSERLPNTSSIFFEGRNNRELLNQLSRNQIYVSTGSACSSGSFEPSHVIRALGKSNKFANSCLRISFGNQTIKEELNKFVSQLSFILG